jgi:hypothetical protein
VQLALLLAGLRGQCYDSEVPRIPKGRVPSHTIRAPEDLWVDYDRACEDLGLSRNEDLIAHMQQRVRAWRRKRDSTSD